MRVTLNVKNKEGVFPIFIIILGIIILIFGIFCLFNKDYLVLYLGIGVIVIGLLVSWIGYSLRRYGKIVIPYTTEL